MLDDNLEQSNSAGSHWFKNNGMEIVPADFVPDQISSVLPQTLQCWHKHYIMCSSQFDRIAAVSLCLI